MRLKLRKGEIIILGRTPEECREAQNILQKAILEVGPGIEYRVVTDEKEILSYGVVQTPAFIIQEIKVKSQGPVPSVDVVREWLKDIS
jgi:hypothetical protein